MDTVNIEHLRTRMIIKIQKWFRGIISRSKRLPLILYQIQNYLKSQNFQPSAEQKDGRINSCLDERFIITLLVQ